MEVCVHILVVYAIAEPGFMDVIVSESAVRANMEQIVFKTVHVKMIANFAIQLMVHVNVLLVFMEIVVKPIAIQEVGVRIV
jgi:hypothetical protein